MKDTKKKWKPSASILRMLRNAGAGRDLQDGLRGRSEHGGSWGTEVALIRRGLITRHGDITPEGVALLQSLGDAVSEIKKAEKALTAMKPLPEML